MAITSAAGATLSKNHSSGVGSPTTVSYTDQSYCGWVKVPSWGVTRTLFTHGGTVIGLNTAGRITLTLSGTPYTGVTDLPTETWIFWGFKRTSSTTNVVKVCWVQCVDSVPSNTTISTEITATQAVPTSPTSFTFHIPALCSVCGFRYASSVDVSSSAFAWGVGQTRNHVWRTPLRFPNDLYDHREISASAGTMTFQGMHAWDSQSGTVTLDPNDPEVLRHARCSAVVAHSNYAGDPIVFEHDPINAYGAFVYTSHSLDLSIRTDCLPATATLDRLTIGAFASIAPTGGDIPDAKGEWGFDGDPALYGYYGGSDHYGHFDWWFFGSPPPAANNPSTGLPWTLADLYGADPHGVMEWGVITAGNPLPVDCRPVNIHEAALSCLYYGQPTASCDESSPPPPPVESSEEDAPGVIGPYVWWHFRRLQPDVSPGSAAPPPGGGDVDEGDAGGGGGAGAGEFDAGQQPDITCS